MEFVYISLQLEFRERKMANMQIWTILWRYILPVINLVRDALVFNMNCIDTETGMVFLLVQSGLYSMDTKVSG